MAEAVLGLVIQKLASLTVEEFKSSASVWKQVQSIKLELVSIWPFLRNADAAAAAELDQGQVNAGVQNWVEQVREEAYRIEDVLDEFTFSVTQLHHDTAGLLGCVFPKLFHFMKTMKLRHRIASDIRDIKSSLAEIQERRKRYGLVSMEEEGSTKGIGNLKHGMHDVSSYCMEEAQIVGNESTRREMIGWLVKERTRHRVLVLVGAGGLGKTTLAANAYKNPDVRNRFDCFAWIEIGKAYSTEDVLRKLLRKFYHSRRETPRQDINEMDRWELIELLKEYSKEKRCMVVFDDVWQADFWKYMKPALLDNNTTGNKIIITTRDRGVADYIAGSGGHIRLLKGLPSDKAWQLFCRTAFHPDGVCPPDLEKLSHDFLTKCEGLPLAIAAVGGLLSSMKTKVDSEWRKLLNNLGSLLERDIHLKDCNRVLCESFNDLPHHLKPCLLYFALFPASYLVKRGRLIRLWIAEGFIQLEDNIKNKAEEVAEGYLTELIRRSLVKVEELSIDKKVRSVRVHELMHEIILRKAKQFSFSQVLKERADLGQQRKSRRITIHRSTSNVVESIHDSKVRSVFLFHIDELPRSFISTLFVANIKLMKILDFEDAPLDYDLPKEVGNLFNLRYLSLRNTKVKVLPKSIGKLFNLETLDLRHTLVSELPEEIKNLKKLSYILACHLNTCHLNHFSFTYGMRTKIQEGIGCLTRLQKLTFVEANSDVVVGELRKLKQLRKLGIRVTNRKGNDLCASISNMEHLKSLNLESLDRDEVIDLQSLASPPQHLELLYLAGSLKKLPDWISSLGNLVKIRLVRSGLTDDPIRLLQGLPNLMELSLVEAYNGEQLHFAQGWFPKLVNLVLADLKELKSMIVDNGAVPLIQSLQIVACPLLEMATGFVELKKLQELVLVDMSKEFVNGVVSCSHSCKVFVIHRVEGKYITEKNYNPPVPPELEQASKDEEGKCITAEKNYSPPVTFGLQQTSKDGKEGNYTTKKDFNPPVPRRLQQPSKDDKEGEYPTMKDFKLPVLHRLHQPSNQQTCKDGSKEEEYQTKKDYNLPLPVTHGLQQPSKEYKEGTYIAEKSYSTQPVSPVLKQTSEDRRDGKYITKQHKKIDKEGTDIAEKSHSTRPASPVLIKTSEDRIEGKYITKQHKKIDKEGKYVTDKHLWENF